MFDKIIQALGTLQHYDFEPKILWVLNPKDYKRIHINKISIRFMKIIKRNRKYGRKTS